MAAGKPNASLNGAGFYVRTMSSRFGRREASSALPFQDRGVASADLGRAPRVFNVSGYLYQDDGGYRDQRDALIEAFETPGPKILVHPEYGRVSVLVGSTGKIDEDTGRLRLANVAFTATETFDQPPQEPRIDQASALRGAAKAARAAAGASFSNPKTGLPTALSDVVSGAQLGALDQVLSDMKKIEGNISATLAQPGLVAEKIDNISRSLTNILNTPQRLFDSFDAAFAQIAYAAKRVLGLNGRDVDQADADPAAMAMARGEALQRAVSPMSAMGSDIPEPPAFDTQDSIDEAQSVDAVQRHMRASGLANLAEALADTPFDSADRALSAGNALAAALADLADSEPDLDADLASALRRTAALTLRYVDSAAGTLPNVVQYTPAATLPVEVIAHALYGDADRDGEILARNPGVRHPGGVPGSQALEVLDQ